jgi:hypothetical protein
MSVHLRKQNPREKRRATQARHSNKKASDQNDSKENLRLLFNVHDAVKVVACLEGGAWGLVLRTKRVRVAMVGCSVLHTRYEGTISDSTY